MFVFVSLFLFLWTLKTRYGDDVNMFWSVFGWSLRKSTFFNFSQHLLTKLFTFSPNKNTLLVTKTFQMLMWLSTWLSTCIWSLKNVHLHLIDRSYTGISIKLISTFYFESWILTLWNTSKHKGIILIFIFNSILRIVYEYNW